MSAVHYCVYINEGLPGCAELELTDLDEIRQVKWRLLYASLALEILSLETPVAWNGDRVTSGLGNGKIQIKLRYNKNSAPNQYSNGRGKSC